MSDFRSETGCPPSDPWEWVGEPDYWRLYYVQTLQDTAESCQRAVLHQSCSNLPHPTTQHECTYMAPKLYQLCREGKLEEVRAALKSGSNVNSRGSLYKTTALMYAITRRSHTQIVKLLLEQPLLGLNSKNTDGETALHYAVLYDNLEALQLLLADPRLNCVNPVTNSGETPLTRALESKKNDMVSVLLAHKGMDLNWDRDTKGRTAVHIAVATCNLEGLQLLLDDPSLRGALNSGDHMSITPLMSAVMTEDRTDLMTLLLKHPEIDVNKRFKSGYTALHYAAYLDRLPELDVILTESGGRLDLNVKENDTGQTALHLAVLKSNNDIVKRLLEHPDLDVNCTDLKGNCVMMFAKVVENFEAMALIMEDKRFSGECKFLLNSKHDSDLCLQAPADSTETVHYVQLGIKVVKKVRKKLRKKVRRKVLKKVRRKVRWIQRRSAGSATSMPNSGNAKVA